jgi:hypothetical protein
MNSIELANALINRAKNLQEFTITTKLAGKPKFNGTVPFDLTIKGNTLTAKILAENADEANSILDSYLKTLFE